MHLSVATRFVIVTVFSAALLLANTNSVIEPQMSLLWGQAAKAMSVDLNEVEATDPVSAAPAPSKPPAQLALVHGCSDVWQQVLPRAVIAAASASWK